VRQRELVSWAQDVWPISERRDCRLFLIQRSTRRYEAHRDAQRALRQRLKESAAVRVRFGYVRLWAMLRREGLEGESEASVPAVQAGLIRGAHDEAPQNSQSCSPALATQRRPTSVGPWIS
jgi:putative transposase